MAKVRRKNRGYTQTQSQPLHRPNLPVRLYDHYSIAKSRLKRIRMALTTPYLLTPKPVRRILAKTNIPAPQTVVRRVVRNRVNEYKRCLRAKSAVRHHVFKAKRTGHSGRKRPQRQIRRCK